LQNPPGEGEGRIKDPGLKSLLRELAHQNPGLCIINTRLEVDDIKDFMGNSAQSIPLDHLSLDSGKELLEHLGVKGEPDELKQASREFGCHALALTLLGSYLTVVYDGDVRKRDKIARLTDEEEHGGHAKRVMESYEEWFKGKPELNILYIMGVFGRPAEGGAIKALMTKPVINGLTSDFKKLSYKNWRFALNRLRKVELLSNEDAFGSDKQDCHPLIREHFGEKLKENNSEAWKEAHSRLYDYYKNQAEEHPDTIEGMVPLFEAVAHGCQAGRYQEALEKVYYPRILRGSEHFSWKKLGSFGADLAVMSGFFDQPWSQSAAELTEASKSFVLAQTGLYLNALGRLAEATQPMQASLEVSISQENWENAAIVAGNFSELLLTMGDLALSVEYAKQSVNLADKSGHAFKRMTNRAKLSDALHQAGHLSEAEATLKEAEEIQKEFEPEYPFLYSVRGFQYCNLLLDQGRFQEVQSRAEKFFEWRLPSDSLLDIGLDHLSLGKAHFLQEQEEETDDFTPAAEHLNKAVDGLRQAGRQDLLPLGLLARSELYRVQGAFEKAQRDLDEAMTIAERGDMGLHQADCHLEYACLYLAMGEKEEDARRNLDTAKEMIREMGYHRRDIDVKEIEEKLL